MTPMGDGLNFAGQPALVRGTVVPASGFFVRSHFRPPDIDGASWSLVVEGRVRRSLTIDLRALRRLPHRHQETWLECAGNSRSRFDPMPEGEPWDGGAVGNAVFTGTPLLGVLEQAGIRDAAVEVVTTGADSPGFQRSLPLSVALRPEVLLVWAMNGRPLPIANGGPVRLLVPRWPGVASVKWARRIEVVDEPFAGYYQTERYVLIDEAGNRHGPLGEMPVKSIIAWPRDRAVVPASRLAIRGFAWSGGGPIDRVDVSVDDGLTWSRAALTTGDGPFAWTRWELPWVPPAVGRFALQARATDVAGETQPAATRWNRFGYLMNAVSRHEVEVRRR
jgi:DMSO/TMAO reductase YedYZ molybdopterin-dependent catalytic subunit